MSMMSVFPGGGTGGGEPGPAGVGIESIEQTTTSTESGGENIITFTKTDGTVDTASVFNGARGEPGPAGRDGYLVHNAQVYSTEETVIGQWADGKPLYRKVLVGTTPSTANTIVRYSFETSLITDWVVNIYGTVKSNDGALPPINFSLMISGSDAAHRISSWGSVSDEGFSMSCGSMFINCPFVVTIEYTKTTDEPTIAIATVNELNAAYEEGVQAA